MRIHIKSVGIHDMKFDEDVCLRDGIAVKDIVDGLSKGSKIFREGMQRNHIVIMRNGLSIDYLQGLDTVLKEGDDLLLIPMQFGG